MEKVRNIEQQIGYAILNLVMKYVELDKKTRYYGTDVPIFHSEIHMVTAIAEHPGIHVGGLAEFFGITKGSVSEIVKKLEKKALVVKETDEENQSRLSLKLTVKGERAHQRHMQYHAIVDGMIEEELQDASEHEVRFLLDFLSNYRTKMELLDQMSLDKE